MAIALLHGGSHENKTERHIRNYKAAAETETKNLSLPKTMGDNELFPGEAGASAWR